MAGALVWVLAAAVVVVAVLVWRLRQASRKVDDSLREEHERPPETSESDEVHEVGHDRGQDGR